MARFVIDTYMVRYPMGGMLSWALQYALGIQQLGHDVFLIEKASYQNACWNNRRGELSDDGSYGWAVVTDLLRRFGLEDRLCFVDYHGQHFGCSETSIQEVLRSADVLIDMGTHGDWRWDARPNQIRVLIDGEPGYSQMRHQLRLDRGQAIPAYDVHFTNGLSIGNPGSSVPTVGATWHHLPNPVATNVYTVAPHPDVDAPFTTVMNWQSHSRFEYKGQTFGQKDLEFEKFIDLPEHTSSLVEVAVAGPNVPGERLVRHGWQVRDALEVTETFDSYVEYLRYSRGEFAVCKNVFVATTSGWTSDRSAAYLASGRPVVMQDTGFSEHIPCGEGLFAVRTVDEAAAAIEEINSDYSRHAQAAREIACEYFDARKVMGRLLEEIGVGNSS